MISLGNAPVNLCEGYTRREWLRAGGITTLGLTLPELLRQRAQAASSRTSFGRAKSCIVVFLFGAPAHQDIWDLKPLAPSDMRGEFRPIVSSVPGIQLGEHVPRIARQAHHLGLIRSVSHPDNTHTVAMHYMLTGVRHARPSTNPQNHPSDFPTFGRCDAEVEARRVRVPAGISLNAPANQVSANNHIFPAFSLASSAAFTIHCLCRRTRAEPIFNHSRSPKGTPHDACWNAARSSPKSISVNENFPNLPTCDRWIGTMREHLIWSRRLPRGVRLTYRPRAR